MVKQVAGLLIFFRLTRPKSRRPTKLGPFILFLGRYAVCRCIARCRRVGQLGGRNGFGRRKVVLVRLSIILFLSDEKQTGGTEGECSLYPRRWQCLWGAVLNWVSAMSLSEAVLSLEA